MKKLLPLIMLLILAGCSSPVSTTGTTPIIIAATFPEYDFTRSIAGDRMNVQMLLPPGAESHSYEPTPGDIIKISTSTALICISQMEPWVEKIASAQDEKVRLVDLYQPDEESSHQHDHEHYHEYHYWTDPNRAKIMVDSITEAICEIDPENAIYYRGNAQDYKKKLDELDKNLRSIVSEGKRKLLVFGGRFAFHYMIDEYGLDYISALESCGDEAEPSPRHVAEIIDAVKEQEIPYIFYEELTDPKTTRLISEQTGAKTLLLHSCHNISSDDMEQGVTYLSLMEKNLENIRLALN